MSRENYELAGQKIQGYTVAKPIGQGKFSIVYRAENEQGIPFALKKIKVRTHPSRFSTWPTSGNVRNASERSTSWKNWTIPISSNTSIPSSTTTNLSSSLSGPRRVIWKNLSKKNKVKICSLTSRPSGISWSRLLVHSSTCMRKELCIEISNLPTYLYLATTRLKLEIWGWAVVSAQKHWKPTLKWEPLSTCPPNSSKIQATPKTQMFGLWAAYATNWPSWNLPSETKRRKCHWWICLTTSQNATTDLWIQNTHLSWDRPSIKW